MKMTTNEMRDAISKSQGWKQKQIGQVYAYYQESDPENIRGMAPNYMTELVAWRGMLTREKLTQDQIVSLLNNLRSLVGERLNIKKVSDFDMLASIIDHTELLAEAFCRMMWPDKWKVEKTTKT